MRWGCVGAGFAVGKLLVGGYWGGGGPRYLGFSLGRAISGMLE